MKRISVVLSTAAALTLALSGCGGSDSGAADSADETTQTTCAEFKELDTEAEKAVVEAILAEHPESQYAGSPNVALGTAKLVCLAAANADKTVAEAAGLLTPAAE
ncbi:MAG TPA: hypothetical protein VK083_13990 [Nocardia sp.]|uniref:hypothetical protein n=1 Tax=Nocardia TaxID=1817 RepID=UPI002453E790|nr:MULTISPECIES: hypothetical protein [Nocardia]HLS77890.1 hypothetical protein [Nocardia sp.]